jgi:malonate transporter and related proteins
MNFAQLLLPDFSLIVLGYLVCRFTALDRPVWEKVESLVYYFLFPVLLFQSIVRAPLDIGAASSLIGAAVCLVIVGVSLAYAVARWPGVEPRDHAANAQIAFRFNSFIALAVMERLGGAEGMLLIAVIIGVCVPLCNIGAVWPMARGSGQNFWGTLLRNPLVLSTAGGLAANLLGFSFPAWAEPTVNRIGQTALVLGLMTAGAGMQLASVFNTASKCITGAGVLTIRHLLMPLTAWGLIQVFSLSPLQATVLLAYSALPTASSCYVLATRMGYDGTATAGFVTLSHALSILSLSLALQFLR